MKTLKLLNELIKQNENNFLNLSIEKMEKIYSIVRQDTKNNYSHILWQILYLYQINLITLIEFRTITTKYKKMNNQKVKKNDR